MSVSFKNKKPNRQKLFEYGFVIVDNEYRYAASIGEGSFTMTVNISSEGRIYTSVIDEASREEYVLHKIAGAGGAFVGRIRDEHDSILDDICRSCWEPDVFKTDLAKTVIEYISKKYGSDPEYLWEKFPNNAIMRRQDNEKWFAALLTVHEGKLGREGDDTIEIIDLRMEQKMIEDTVDNIRYYPGYHMNKKHWITICLDGSVSSEELFRLIDESYELADKRKKRI